MPAVFYGDLYEADKGYMTTKTPYYDDITKLLSVRKLYASGDQKVSTYTDNTSAIPGQDLIASVRYGTSRSSGVATVIGDNQNTDTTITVNMGTQHANQLFTNALGAATDQVMADANGVLTIHVKGGATPQVHGYLGVWVPLVWSSAGLRPGSRRCTRTAANRAERS